MEKLLIETIVFYIASELAKKSSGELALFLNSLQKEPRTLLVDINDLLSKEENLQTVRDTAKYIQDTITSDIKKLCMRN